MNENDHTRTTPAPFAEATAEAMAAVAFQQRDDTLPHSPAQSEELLSTFATGAALRVPGYDLMPEIARGGMGVVWADRKFELTAFLVHPNTGNGSSQKR